VSGGEELLDVLDRTHRLERTPVIVLRGSAANPQEGARRAPKALDSGTRSCALAPHWTIYPPVSSAGAPLSLPSGPVALLLTQPPTAAATHEATTTTEPKIARACVMLPSRAWNSP